MPPAVSVVIPARDAGDTLGATLASLRAQTFAAWEAIVVDDDSSDDTAAVATAWAARDPRIRLLGRPRGGVSAARNDGVAAARHDWLLFLDADDRLEPDHLLRMAVAIAGAPGSDLAHCGWRRTAGDGTSGPEHPAVALDDPFLALARYCPFTVHAAVVRRSAVVAASGFDPGASPCEDWDLWQRLARAGARFLAVPGPCAPYSVCPGSHSSDPARFLTAALAVIRRGHGPDGRVPHPQPRYAAGVSAVGLAAAGFYCGAWVAGLAIGQGGDATGLLPFHDAGPAPDLDPERVAAALLDTLPAAAGMLGVPLPALWSRVATRTEAYLVGLEAVAQTPDLARRTLWYLERMTGAVPPAPVEQSPADAAERPRSILGRTCRRLLRRVPGARPMVGLARRMLAGTVEERPERDDAGQPAVAVPSAEACTPRDEPAYLSPAYWEEIFACPDPWDYTNGYETLKYAQTLDMLPHARIGRVLELACAEGHFTERLAGRVGHLTATDISATALGRAAERCRRLGNLSFLQLDLTRDALPGPFELIVCSEVLYYLEDRDALRAVARRLAEQLEPGGWLLTAHANLVVDEPTRTGFTWPHPFGAKVIGETFAETGTLHLVREARTALYRIHLFRRDPTPADRPTPELVELTCASLLPADLTNWLAWRGTALPPEIARARPADGVPVLRCRHDLAAGTFGELLVRLRGEGFYGVTLDAWRAAMRERRPLPGRTVVITFDGGRRELLTRALPLLHRHGFPATIFLTTDEIGDGPGTPASQLSWPEMRQMGNADVAFGALGTTCRPATGPVLDQMSREEAKARAALEQRLERPVTAIAYPGAVRGEAVRRAMRACGYETGLSCRPACSRLGDDPIDLPRIELTGTDDAGVLAAMLDRHPSYAFQ